MDERQAKELGRKLRERRETLGMSLRQLEEKSGVFNVTIMRIERGDSTDPSAEKLARLAEALDLPRAASSGHRGHREVRRQARQKARYLPGRASTGRG